MICATPRRCSASSSHDFPQCRPARGGAARLQEQSLLVPLPPCTYGAITCYRCRAVGRGAVLCTLHGTDVLPDHLGRLRPHPWSAVVSCGRCGMIAAVCQGEQYPPDDWPDDRGVPAHVSGAYAEARECLAAGHYTAAAMLCRKLIMNLAADHGAKAGRRYAEYVGWLAEKGYITGAIRERIEFVRDRGNDANHHLGPVGRKRAMSAFMLTTELMRRVYELDHLPDGYFAAYCETRMDALPPPSTPAEIRDARDARARICSPCATLDEYMGGG